MKIIPVSQATDRSAITDTAAVIDAGGVVCFPMAGSYRLAADVMQPTAIEKLLQSKRRTSNHPALILLPSFAHAKAVVRGTEWKTTKLVADKLWPAAVTVLLEPSKDLAPKIKKVLTKATGKLGIRVASDPLPSAIVAACNRPLLVSSANIENKAGATSAAAIKQRFIGKIDLWIDGGDIAPGSPSTLIELTEASWKMVREGAVADKAIAKVLGEPA